MGGAEAAPTVACAVFDFSHPNFQQHQGAIEPVEGSSSFLNCGKGVGGIGTGRREQMHLQEIPYLSFPGRVALPLLLVSPRTIALLALGFASLL